MFARQSITRVFDEYYCELRRNMKNITISVSEGQNGTNDVITADPFAYYTY